MPLSRGIEMSRTITWGRVLAARSTSARPSRAVPRFRTAGRANAGRRPGASCGRRRAGCGAAIGAVIVSVSPLAEIIRPRDGHAHFDPRAFARVRIDGKPPMHAARALAHADEAELAIGAHRLRIEPDAVIGYGEAKLAALHCQFDSCRRPSLCFTTLCSASCAMR